MRADYLSTDAILDLQKAFNGHMEVSNIDLQRSPVREIKNAMFDYFQQSAFLDRYMLVARNVADSVGLTHSDLVLQSVPTPRIFRPQAHGTSFHCDFWYGHGLSTYTIWLPLTPVEPGNSFFICSEESQELLYEKLVRTRKFTELEEELLEFSAPVLPAPGSAFMFHSKVLHGSPKNTSSKTRVSFDFRIGSKFDKTSTKDLANYYHFKDGEFILPKHKLDGKRVLKYICGGEGKNTFAQHAIIEESAKRYNINISEQEAEIERYGFPMFHAYLTGVMKHKQVDGIIVASQTILDKQALALASASDVPVWCALENKFLD
jgi:hypothetical protein